MVSLVVIFSVCTAAVVAATGLHDGRPAGSKGDIDFFYCPSDQRPIPEDYVCDGYADCVNGADENDCGSAGGIVQCQKYEMTCQSDRNCLNLAFQCDGHADCSDGSDERGCDSTISSCERRCSNGKCISNRLVCDGNSDCQDNSDEIGCDKCDAETEWRCPSNGQCISHNWLCDRERDCEDGADEDNCQSYSNSCGIGMFNCSSTSCINGNLVCDGFDDCTNGADEDESICYILNCDEKFTCPEKCIGMQHVCNGEYDCIDNTDEMNCDSKCPPDKFACITGSCIPIAEKCDGNEDCTDGSDEFLCRLREPVNCTASEFPCADKLQCVPEFSLCDPNQMEQCRDGSDETSCPLHAVEGINECNETDNGGCEHLCHDTRYYRYCSCHDGYHLNTTDLSSCLDIDECDTMPGICSHYCQNTHGSYTCSCADGYSYSSLHGCKATGPAAYLLFTNWFDIQRVTTGGNMSDILVRQLRNAASLDFHHNFSYIFWTDIMRHCIMRANLNGSDIREIISYGVDRPEGIAVDWIHNHIYWTDSSLKRVEVANLNGGQRTVLFSGLHSPKDIIVDPINKWLFWTDRLQIVKASLDGVYKSVFLSSQDHVYWPKSLTLDHPTQTLYWIDAASKSIGKCNVDGSKRQTLLSVNISNPSGLTVFENKIYWSERDEGVINSVNKGTGGQFHTVLGSIYMPIDLIVVHPLRQPRDTGYFNPCSVRNGKCQHLCLVGPHSSNVTCYCPPSSTLHEDMKTCSKSAEFILFSMSEQLRTVSLETEDRYDLELPLAGGEEGSLSNIVAIDWYNDTIYYADSSLHTINSFSLSGDSTPIVLVSNDVSSPTGIAVDWLSKKLYWSDSYLSRIYVSELDGSSISVILSVTDGVITDLVVHPIKGLLFYGVSGHKYSFIRRANLDGSNVSTMYRGGKYGIPKVLALDYNTERLYWVDTRSLLLESISVDGNQYEELRRLGELSSTTGLGVHQDKLYWTDQTGEAIRWIDKTPPYNNGLFLANRASLGDLTVYHQNRTVPESHPCWVNNGGCSHLCLAVPSSAKGLTVSCQCPIGFSLASDSSTCQSYLKNYLVFAGEGRIGRVSLDTHSDVDVTTPVLPPPQNVISIDVDLQTNDSYWIDRNTAGIYRTPFGGGARQLIISSCEEQLRPTALAIDWIGRLIYWAESGTRRIIVSHLNGSYHRVLFSGLIVGEVSSIALDIRNHHIFWASSTNSRVVRAYLDGSNPLPIISSPNIILPISLSLDNRKLYIADSVKEQILSFNKDGTGKTVIASTPNPQGLAVDDTHVYWADRQTSVLYKADKTSSINNVSPIVLVRNMANINDLAIAKRSEWLQRGGFQHRCASHNPCSVFCLPTLDAIGYKCSCPTGIELASDDHSCPNTPSIYLLFSTSTAIRRISQDTQDFFDICLIKDLEGVVYLDYYKSPSVNGRIVWSDFTNGVIMSSDLNGLNTSSLISVGGPKGLSVDQSTGNVYFIDSMGPRIGIVTIDGKYSRVLINNTHLINPTSLVVHPKKGTLYWIDIDTDGVPCIKQASVNGSNVGVLLINDTIHPVDLALDMTNDWLYWTDRFEGSIQRYSLNASNESTVETIVTGYHRPLGLTVYKNLLFWTNKTTGQILRMDWTTLRVHTIYFNRGAGMATGLVLVSNEQEFTSCSSGHDCAHFCLPMSSHRYECVCSDTDNNDSSNCIEHMGSPSTDVISSSSSSVLSRTMTSSQVNTLTSSQVNTLSTASASATPSYNGPDINLRDEMLVGGLTNGELVILSLICILVIAVLFIIIVIVLLYRKYKSIGKASPDVYTTTTKMVKNPLYKEKSFSSIKGGKKAPFVPDSLPKLSNLPQRQLNNTVDLKDRKNVNVKQAVEPQVYKLTPVQSRHKHSSVTTPPRSPALTTTAVVHSSMAPPTSSIKSHRLPPPIPVHEVSFSLDPVPANKKKVKFEVKTGSPDPPPIPPRSIPSYPVPVSPVTTPPLSPAHMLVSGQNPLFHSSTDSCASTDESSPIQ